MIEKKLKVILEDLDKFKDGHIEHLPRCGSWPESVHQFDEHSLWAIKAALAAERPLLVRGEPGCGKSQLARAAAQLLGRAFVAEVIHSRTESRDLQWHFDAVARLGEAQTLGVSGKTCDVEKCLDAGNFLSPGALWWTFEWHSAETQFGKCNMGMPQPECPPGWKPEKGCVLLIDEIDKADADLPNGLLETLGNGAFTVPYVKDPIGMSASAPPPLVVITTKEGRGLPAAFFLRCLLPLVQWGCDIDGLVALRCVRGTVD
ncbi:MAG: AAA domain-containing protein, partial [bacterium]|nr:AAA domain-containing protein [bacterium]